MILKYMKYYYCMGKHEMKKYYNLMEIVRNVG